MIISDKQLTMSVRELNRLQDGLQRIECRAPGNAREVADDALALKSHIAVLKKDIRAFRALKRGGVKTAKCSSLKELSTVLVKARILSGMTQSDLARSIGTPPQQVQRYESTKYSGVGLRRVIQIAEALDVKVTAEYQVPDVE